jgi:hypothetical protein
LWKIVGLLLSRKTPRRVFFFIGRHVDWLVGYRNRLGTQNISAHPAANTGFRPFMQRAAVAVY